MPPPMRYERALLNMREGDPGDPESQMHEVVQHRHVEDSQQRRIGVMAGEGELVIVRGDAPNEAQQADGQKHCADCKGSLLNRRPETGCGFGRACRTDAVISDFHLCGFTDGAPRAGSERLVRDTRAIAVQTSIDLSVGGQATSSVCKTRSKLLLSK